MRVDDRGNWRLATAFGAMGMAALVIAAVVMVPSDTGAVEPTGEPSDTASTFDIPTYAPNDEAVLAIGIVGELKFSESNCPYFQTDRGEIWVVHFPRGYVGVNTPEGRKQIRTSSGTLWATENERVRVSHGGGDLDDRGTQCHDLGSDTKAGFVLNR